MKITCAYCGKECDKPDKEIRRQLKQGHTDFYCNQSCGAKARKRIVEIVKVCNQCGAEFTTQNDPNESIFCSRSCASKGSVTEFRRRKAHETTSSNPEWVRHIATSSTDAAACLKKREAWKYVKIKALLESKGEPHEFDYALPGTSSIYDLALFEQKLLIEFDGPSHNFSGQQVLDIVKDQVARLHGWDVLRIPVSASAIIPEKSLQAVI